MVHFLKQFTKEVERFPLEIREDLTDLVAKLEIGLKLSMPISRPMPNIGKNVHELRLKDRSGGYRMIYVFIESNEIYFLHGFKKTSEQTPKLNITVAQKRLREII